MTRRNSLNVLTIAVAVLFMSGCAGLQSARHEYVMRGQVLEVDGPRAYICVGTADGAKIGQVLNVQRYVRKQDIKTNVSYDIQKTGTARVTELVDEHFAWVTVVSGTLEKGYTVELTDR
jgi:hypothetical protein